MPKLLMMTKSSSLFFLHFRSLLFQVLQECPRVRGRAGELRAREVKARVLLLKALEQEASRVVLCSLCGLLLLVPRESGCPGLARVGLRQVEVESAVLCLCFECEEERRKVREKRWLSSSSSSPPSSSSSFFFSNRNEQDVDKKGFARFHPSPSTLTERPERL